MKNIKNFIDGKLVDPISKQYIENIEPATGKVYGNLPDSKKEDVGVAVDAAKAAFSVWSKWPVQKRSDVLMKWADLIDANKAEFIEAESRDNGKPMKLAAHVDIPRASANLRFFATAIIHYASESHKMDDVAINYTLRAPIGVAACISPWNLPLYLFTWKIAPALAAGNTVVAKPSELTPMTAFLLSKLANEAGLPSGTFNIVHGYGHHVGQAMTEHPDVGVVSFTGGTETGKKIASTIAPMFKKYSLELGGKNPNIIFSDADLEDAVKTSVHSSFANQGQICLCGSRIFVQSEVYDQFVEQFVSRVRRLQIGDPEDDATQVGALVSKAHLEKVEGYIQLAKEEGGTILFGGQRPIVAGRCADGYFLTPTVIVDLDPYCRTNTEEIFGPVVTITPFETEEEVLAYANGTPYGLSATVWTDNLKRGHRVAEFLKMGIVWLNCWLVRDLRTPFGGMKQSGVGREGGLEALRFFTEPKNVCVKY